MDAIDQRSLGGHHPAVGLRRGTLLRISDLDVHIGAQQILFGIDLSVAEGEVVALLGPNGAGKTTLLRTVAGLRRPSRGTVTWRDAPLGPMSAAARVEVGVTFVPGEGAVFPSLSVWENLLVGCHRFAWDRQRVEVRVGAVVDLFPRLGERFEQRAGSLSGGEQQMLALAKGLLPEPTLLLVDELALGLAPVVVNDLRAALAHLKTAGTTMVLVEQSARVTREIADRTVGLDRGTITPR